jgi:hypothetical protein
MFIRFHYLYRDGGNYKRYGWVDFPVFAIPDLPVELEFIGSHLVDGEFFDHRIFRVPDLFFPIYDEELDHDLHEFSHLEYVGEGIGEITWEDWKKGLEMEKFGWDG